MNNLCIQWHKDCLAWRAWRTWQDDQTSALNLNVHFDMLFLDGVYTEDARGKMCFHRVKAPTQEQLRSLVHTLSHRVARFLERSGLLERDVENSYLIFEQQEEDVMQQLYGH